MKASKFCALALLGALAAGCGKQFDVASDVALKHQNGAAVQRQIELLEAEQVKVSAPAATGGTGPAVLTLEVVNPSNQPVHPDSLKYRMRKLARLLVADLASPSQYQVVNAQATFKKGLFSRDNSTSSQAVIYPVASLR
jgi:hypothetical protein